MTAPEGWYVDPSGGDFERWWSGQSWTEHTREARFPLPLYAPPAATGSAAVGSTAKARPWYIRKLVIVPAAVFGILILIRGIASATRSAKKMHTAVPPPAATTSAATSSAATSSAAVPGTVASPADTSQVIPPSTSVVPSRMALASSASATPDVTHVVSTSAKASAPPAVSTHVAPPPPPVTTKPTAPASTSKAVAPPANLCGAPVNPMGYNFCSGSFITTPDPRTCSFSACIANFSKGKGYMEECRDGTYSMSGGRSGACSDHGGEDKTVYA